MIKYECDVCKQIKNPAEIYGPGVVPHLRPFLYSVDGLTLEITPHKGELGDHVCGACLGRALWMMVREVWPEDEKDRFPIKMLVGEEDVITPGSDSTSTDVREVRAESEVRRTGPDVYVSPGTEAKCESCHGYLINPALKGCDQSIVHPDPQRRIRDNPQA